MCGAMLLVIFLLDYLLMRLRDGTRYKETQPAGKEFEAGNLVAKK